VTPSAAPPPAGDDTVLVENARRSSPKFDPLWRGAWRGLYTSQSEADLALCVMLARSYGNAEFIDRMFRASALMREKWDEARGSATYGERTIKEAMARNAKGFALGRRRFHPHVLATQIVEVW
jgi:putative DNA primase/helicase